MYQVLYRKYRPIEFNELVGQEVIKKTLLNEFNNNKLSHAYLFAGPRGTGKTSIAKLFSKLINCEKPLDNKPCNKCVPCTQNMRGSDTDIIEIDGASNNGVDEIRELKSKVNLVPSFGKYKVYIIDEVHMMTTSAFNALLKTLEEPPKHVIFILATTDPQKIPTTILSRCQRFDFKKISEENIILKLKEIIKKEKIKISDEVIESIALFSDGGMRDAISVLDQISSYTNGEIMINDFNEVVGLVNKKDLNVFINNVLNSELEKALKFIQLAEESGKDVINIMKSLINELRLKLFDSVYENRQIFNFIKSANDYYNEMKASDNPKLLFELFVIENFKTDKKEEEKIKELKPVLKNQEEKEEENFKFTDQTKKAEPASEEPNNNIYIDIETIKNIRVGNALANLDKKQMNSIAKDLNDLVDLSVKSKYKKLISVLVDGQIKAFGNDHLIYVFKEEYCANLFNENLIMIEEIIFEKTEKKYKTIAVNSKEWEKIKKDFNSKQKKYKYTEENFNIQMFAKKKNKNEKEDKIKEVFGEIVNYK